jgi:hypothetical protein
MLKVVEDAFDRPEEITFDLPGLPGSQPGWSSYCFSPAAMFNPQVLENLGEDQQGGYKSPGSLPAGFRAPGVSQARYPDLKTRMIEHSWLQNRRGPECNPNFQPGDWDGCEPYYFVHSVDSSPVTLFFDGHIGTIGVNQALRADERMRVQTGSPDWGLWSKDTPMGANGYFHDASFDTGQRASFHILTTDGILGRDIFTE